MIISLLNNSDKTVLVDTEQPGNQLVPTLNLETFSWEWIINYGIINKYFMYIVF